MRRAFTALIALSAIVIGAQSPVRAITGNFVKDFEHPFVGLAVFYDAKGEFSHRCSGSLLSPHVFLTAGHCVADVAAARVISSRTPAPTTIRTRSRIHHRLS